MVPLADAVIRGGAAGQVENFAVRVVGLKDGGFAVLGRPCRIGGFVITEIRERDDAVKEGNGGDAEKIDTRQADVMIFVGDEGEFGRCGGLCVLFGRGGFLRFERRERARGFFGNKAAVCDIEHINVQEHVQRGEEQDLNGRGRDVGVIEVQNIRDI